MADTLSHPAILSDTEKLGEQTLTADPAQIVALCQYLKGEAKYIRLSAVSGVDWHPAEPRFEIVYHLQSIEKNSRIRVKCKVGGENPEIDSVTGIWRGADWYEREIWDMFGVQFRNHPNHQRILMPLDWDGHPLRKDYPVHGYKYSYPED